MSIDDSPLGLIARLLNGTGLEYALIGGHAVNVWLEPRFTADIDITVAADAEHLQGLEDVLSRAGFSKTVEHGAELPSGPDFARWVSNDGTVLEAQLAKTELQQQLLRRAVPAESGLRVATREDLIVLKLIADRGKDRADLQGLCSLDQVDWAYVEHWAREWEVLDRLERFRHS